MHLISSLRRDARATARRKDEACACQGAVRPCCSDVLEGRQIEDQSIEENHEKFWRRREIDQGQLHVKMKNLAAAAQQRKGLIKSEGQQIKSLPSIKIDEEFLRAENEVVGDKKEQEIVDWWNT